MVLGEFSGEGRLGKIREKKLEILYTYPLY